jgi:PAS domain S-box-containing protein
MPDGVSPASTPRAPWRVTAGVALVYMLTGLLALQMAIPPGYASPIYPSAGIALAAVLVFGWPGLAAAALGAFLVNAVMALARGPFDGASVLVPAAISGGAALQAAVGAALVRRFVAQPLTLTEPRDIVRFGLLGAALACMVNAIIGSAALWAAGAVSTGQLASNMLTWWVGDTLGVLIGAPVALTLLGRPRASWAARRRTVALPLLAATGLLVLAALAVGRWDEDRLRATFQRDAMALTSEVEARLAQPLHALQAVHGIHEAGAVLDDHSLAVATRWWLAQPMAPRAIGAGWRVARADIAAFEAEARSAGLADFRVFEPPSSAVADAAEDVVAIRLIEPRGSNAGAFGVNALSIAAARTAILQARRSGQPVASAGFHLQPSATDPAAIVIFQALYGSAAGSDAEREAAFVGVVFVSLSAEQAFGPLPLPAGSYLSGCLVDLDPAATTLQLAGPPGCAQRAPAAFESRRRLRYAGRDWELRVTASERAVPGLQESNAWPFAVAGLLGAALLGALLLLVTGRTRRIEEAVADRTAELQREVAVRRASDEALRDSEARLRSIFEHVPIGLTFIDPRGYLVQSNPRLSEMLGWSAQELGTLTVDDVSHADESAENRRQLKALLSGAILQVDRVLRMQRADGELFWARARLSVMRGESGQALRLVGVLEDITEHLRLEQAERERDRAESANRTKNEFVSRMSHELRTPLNAMIGFAQLLGMAREPALPPAQREWVAQIQRAGWHLLEMINDTLDLARIESGLVALTLRPIELEPLLGHCVAMVSSTAATQGVRIGVTLADDARTVVGDDTRLTQVLTNLLSNAVKYNRAGGTVSVQSRRVGGRGGSGSGIDIEVHDSGLGMSAEQLGALFQPYNRLGRENSGIEGTGIGLVISRRLAELMGGTLVASSRAGAGSTFTLRLPVADVARLPAPVPSPADELLPYRQRRVHYIEDNETNVEVMRGILAQRPQVLLSVSTLGLDGLDAVRRQRPDLILLDMQLPDISGLELLRHLKQGDRDGDIPVVVVSADATPAHVEQALTLGALHYVTKPVAVADFLTLLDDLLEAIDTHWG